jgi:rhodanese-related sulfurtransferase
MSFGDILLYLIIGLVLYYIIRRVLLQRSVTSYSSSETKEKIKNRNAILLDVRTPDERKKDSIKGSLHIPLYDLRKRSEELKKFRDKEIICYCRSGSRSLTAAGMLKKQGLNAASLKGGITRWQNG